MMSQVHLCQVSRDLHMEWHQLIQACSKVHHAWLRVIGDLLWVPGQGIRCPDSIRHRAACHMVILLELTQEVACLTLLLTCSPIHQFNRQLLKELVVHSYWSLSISRISLRAYQVRITWIHKSKRF